MKRVLVLGATGRSGSAVISHLSGRVEIVAGLRTEVDRSRLPGDACIAGTALVDLASIASLQRAMRDMDAVVNAIRLREDIPATALVDLHRLILDAAPGAHPPLIVTVGGGRFTAPARPAEVLAVVGLPRPDTAAGPRPRRVARPPGGRIRGSALGLPDPTPRLHPRSPGHRRLPGVATIRGRVGIHPPHHRLHRFRPGGRRCARAGLDGHPSHRNLRAGPG